MNPSFYIEVVDTSAAGKERDDRIQKILSAITDEFSHHSTGHRLFELFRVPRGVTPQVYRGWFEMVPMTTLKVYAPDAEMLEEVAKVVRAAWPYTLDTVHAPPLMVIHCLDAVVTDKSLILAG